METMVNLKAGRMGIGVAVAVLFGLVALWLLGYIIGIFVRLLEFVAIVAIALVVGYALYELWDGWSRAG